MHINIETTVLGYPEALALAVMIHAMHPTVLGQVSLMASASHLALAAAEGAGDVPPLKPEEAFSGGVPAVMPTAEEAFAGPQAQPGAIVATTATAPDGSTVTQNSGPASVPPSAEVPYEVDATGLPWDSRIHSGGKATVAGGKWKKKKGVGADTVKAVEAELRARMATTPFVSSTAAALLPPANAAPTSSMTAITPAVPAAPAAAIAPPAPAAPAVPAPPAPPASVPATGTGPADASGATTGFPPDVAAQALAAAATNTGAFAEGQAPPVVFATVMRRVTDGAFSAEELASACAAVGITSPRELLAKIGLCPDFVATLDALQNARVPA